MISPTSTRILLHDPREQPACAAASEDGALAAALHLEAAILRWRTGDRQQAIHEMEAARAQAPGAAEPRSRRTPA